MKLSRKAFLSALVFALGSLAVCDAFAGRRGVRVDAGAWNAPQPIGYDLGGDTCPDAKYYAWFNSQLNKSFYYGEVHWPEGETRPDGKAVLVQFVTSSFEGLTIFNCQTSRAYTPGAFPEEYLNESIFPPEEAWLGAMIGANTDNSVHATRYSWLGEYSGGYYGRQWVFYRFANGRTVVALYGSEEGQINYEWIWEYYYGTWLWKGEENPNWNGEYFCFQDGVFEGYCEIFRSGFED